MWRSLVDRVQHLAEGGDFRGDLPTQDSHQSMPHSHVSSLSCPLSSRRRRAVGPAAWRIWPGYHCPHWLLALPGASERPRDASTPPVPRAGHHRTHGNPKARTAIRELVSLYITDRERIACTLDYHPGDVLWCGSGSHGFEKVGR